MTGTAIYHAGNFHSRTHLESHIQAILERCFHMLRQRVTAYLETQGRLPVVFWMQSHDFLVRSLVPVFVEGVTLGIEQIHPYRALRGEQINHTACLQAVVYQIAGELAGEVTATAGNMIADLLAGDAGLPEVSATLLQRGPLSADCAQQLAVSEAQRLLAAGHILARQAQPEELSTYARLLS